MLLGAMLVGGLLLTAILAPRAYRSRHPRRQLFLLPALIPLAALGCLLTIEAR